MVLAGVVVVVDVVVAAEAEAAVTSARLKHISCKVSVNPMRVVSLPLSASEITLLPDAVSEDMKEPRKQ